MNHREAVLRDNPIWDLLVQSFHCEHSLLFFFLSHLLDPVTATCMYMGVRLTAEV